MKVLKRGPNGVLYALSDETTTSRHGIVAGKPYRLVGPPPRAEVICYLCERSDYGCADDDERGLRVDCVAMTLSPHGDYPFFVVPVALLDEVQP